MKYLILLALAVALHAEDAPATVEQLQAKVAEQEIELAMLRNGLGQCQATVIHQQAQQQALKTMRFAPAKDAQIDASAKEKPAK